VSKRTLYQLYDGKDELVTAYLSTMRERRVVPSERVLFDEPDPVFRGCPFHNVAVELTTPGHPALSVGAMTTVDRCPNADEPRPDRAERRLVGCLERAGEVRPNGAGRRRRWLSGRGGSGASGYRERCHDDDSEYECAHRAPSRPRPRQQRSTLA
jgi:hypothetical protein